MSATPGRPGGPLGARGASRTLGDRVAGPFFLACAGITGLLLAAAAWVLLAESARFFADVPVARFLGDLSWAPLAEEPGFGVLVLLAGTAQVAAGATAIAVGPGLLTAIFLHYHADSPLARAGRAAVAVLAAIPAVAYGFLALTFLTPALRFVWPATEAFNGLSACIAVAAMILPTIVATSCGALARVPPSLVEEGVALGSPRSRVLVRLAIPSAWAGMAGGVVLALARAAGETMIVVLAAGSPAGVGWSPLEGVRTATVFLVQASAGGLSPGTLEYRACFAVALVLLLLTFGLQALGGALTGRGDRMRGDPGRGDWRRGSWA